MGKCLEAPHSWLTAANAMHACAQGRATYGSKRVAYGATRCAEAQQGERTRRTHGVARTSFVTSLLRSPSWFASSCATFFSLKGQGAAQVRKDGGRISAGSQRRAQKTRWHQGGARETGRECCQLTRLNSGRKASSCPCPSRMSSPILFSPDILPSQSSATAAGVEDAGSEDGCGRNKRRRASPPCTETKADESQPRHVDSENLAPIAACMHSERA